MKKKIQAVLVLSSVFASLAAQAGWHPIPSIPVEDQNADMEQILREYSCKLTRDGKAPATDLSPSLVSDKELHLFEDVNAGNGVSFKMSEKDGTVHAKLVALSGHEQGASSEKSAEYGDGLELKVANEAGMSYQVNCALRAVDPSEGPAIAE